MSPNEAASAPHTDRPSDRSRPNRAVWQEPPTDLCVQLRGLNATDYFAVQRTKKW